MHLYIHNARSHASKLATGKFSQLFIFVFYPLRTILTSTYPTHAHTLSGRFITPVKSNVIPHHSPPINSTITKFLIFRYQWQCVKTIVRGGKLGGILQTYLNKMEAYLIQTFPTTLFILSFISFLILLLSFVIVFRHLPSYGYSLHVIQKII